MQCDVCDQAIIDVNRCPCEVIVCGVQTEFERVEFVVATEVLDGAYGVLVQRVLGRLVGGKGDGACPLSIGSS